MKLLPQSIAAHAEISPGMELKSVDGIETPDWESVRLALVTKIGDTQTEVEIAPFGSSQKVSKDPGFAPLEL
ncbi:Regulator of sigma E protease [Serratia fonticola]|uniref:Regulator of sigma E protease n=1 Tax=Serratia fonticola TaxID=47917 RepID=A0A4U9WR25_SERFO|nr:Regulator of sigma E protease [Serratia fonticola]